jgi:hypothetical protein
MAHKTLQPQLYITDGVTKIHLIGAHHGFYLADWRPSVATLKSGGYYRSSALVDGSRLIGALWANTTETLELRAVRTAQDVLARDLSDLFVMLENARDYWLSNVPRRAVYLVAKSAEETNTRYAIIHNWSLPDISNPYSQGFASVLPFLDGFSLVIERGHWQSVAPELSECLGVYNMKTRQYPQSLYFDGVSSSLSAGSDAGLDNLSSGAFTAEAWIRPEFDAFSSPRVIIGKGSSSSLGWYMYMTVFQNLAATIYAATDANSIGSRTTFELGKWYHVALVYNNAGDRKAHLFVNGREETYSAQTASVGAYDLDAATSLYIGSVSSGANVWDGSIGWTRVSNSARYTSIFQPPSQFSIPTIDGNTLGLWIREGTGTAIDNMQGTAARDGTATGTTWSDNFWPKYGNAAARVAALTYRSGAFANVGSESALDYLADNANGFTVEAWIRSDSGGAVADRIIAWKANLATTGWYLFLRTNGRVGAIVEHSVSSANETGSNVFENDDTWHHVAFTYDKTSKKVLLFADGNIYPSTVTNTGVGTPGDDSAETMTIGGRVTAANAFDGDIGWVRVSTGKRYTGSYQVPHLCEFPGLDADTVGLWGYEGYGTKLHNRVSATEGSITGAIWIAACDTAEFPLSPDVEDPACSLLDYEEFSDVFVANNDSPVQLSHIFVDDGGSFGSNLLAAGPGYALLPAVPVANDAVYFGVEALSSTIPVNTGPFWALAFYLATAASGVSVTWEYWSGAAWSALPSFGSLTSVGPLAIAFTPQANIAITTVNTISGYWVRARVTAVSSPVSPVQGPERHVYAINSPNVNVPLDGVQGDIPALGRIRIMPVTNTTKVIAGLKLDDESRLFNAFLNTSDEASQSYSFSTTGSSTVIDQVLAPTGRAMRYNPAGAEAIGIEGTWLLPNTNNCYTGEYRAFLRYLQSGGSASDFSARLAYGSDYVTKPVTSTVTLAQTVGTVGLADMGQIRILSNEALVEDDNYTFMKIDIHLANTNGAPGDLYIFDLILIPTDVWAGEFYSLISTTAVVQYDLDSAIAQKQTLRALHRDGPQDGTGGGFINAPLGQNGSGAIEFKTNTRQSLWFLSIDTTTGATIPNINEILQVRIEYVRRYLALRGNQ